MTPPVSSSPVQVRALVAECIAGPRYTATRSLERAGYAVVPARDAHAVLNLVARESFDLVVLDLELPGFDAVAITARIRGLERQHGGHVPVVALTSPTSRSERQACLAAGADACISRPLNPGGFVEVVDHLRETHHPVAAHSGNDHHSVASITSATPAPQDEDDRLFRRLQLALIDSTRLSIEKLRKAIETRESVTIHQMAQGVRGALVLFKADRAAVRAAELEESGARGDLRKARQLMPKLAAEVSAALAKARNQLRDSPAKRNHGRNGKDRHPSGSTEGGA